jgi:hypothetical protein
MLNYSKSSFEFTRMSDQSGYPQPIYAPKYNIGVLKWDKKDGIADIIGHELTRLNQNPIPFRLNTPIPQLIDVLFTYGPYGKTLPVWQQVASCGKRKPLVVHWNTEGMPDIRIPLSIMQMLGNFRSKVSQIGDSRSRLVSKLAGTQLVEQIDRSMYRWRYWGDYQYAYHRKWLHLLADSSIVYCGLRTKAGIPTHYLPWGSTPDWYEDMNLERDIDVLWLGKRGSSRRSKILDQVVGNLRALGVKVHVADSVESPFIFDEERTEYLNRSKVTLNITRTWFDDNFSRFAMAAPNRSLIVSETMLPHCPEYTPGVHYVSAPVPELSKTILHYLENDRERQTIIQNAYLLTTQQLTFANSLRKILTEITAYRHAHSELFSPTE